MSQLSFKNQGLKVDWIGFNFEKLSESDLKIVATFLSERGFNSTLTEKKDQEWTTKQLITHPTNHFKVEIQQHYYQPENKQFWSGTKINFTGENANSFYSQTLQPHSDRINRTSFWSVLSSVTNLKRATLARLDLCFDRSNKENENEQTFRIFLEACQSYLLDKYKRGVIKLERNEQGFILTIGSRQSPKYFRVYQKKTSTRFELEIKNKDQYLKSIQNLLFQNSKLAFEEQLTDYFYSHSKKVLNLTFSYTDWLVSFFQKQRYSQTHLSFLASYFEADYSFSSDIKQLQQLYRFLQFLSFSQTQSYTPVEIASHKYQLIKFQVQDFLEFIQVKNPSEYTVQQHVNFFHGLVTTPPLVNIFSDRQFQILATFPFVHVHQLAGVWKAEIYFNSQLCTYQYPFYFPKSYVSCQDRYDIQVKLQIIQSFANTSLKKKFNVLEFLARFANSSNQTKAYVKKLILHSLQLLLKDKLITEQITLQVLGNKRKDKPQLSKTLQIQFKQLSPLLLGKTKTLYYFEII